jgi:hypothetical protein
VYIKASAPMAGGVYVASENLFVVDIDVGRHTLSGCAAPGLASKFVLIHFNGSMRSLRLEGDLAQSMTQSNPSFWTNNALIPKLEREFWSRPTGFRKIYLPSAFEQERNKTVFRVLRVHWVNACLARSHTIA